MAQVRPQATTPSLPRPRNEKKAATQRTASKMVMAPDVFIEASMAERMMKGKKYEPDH